MIGQRLAESGERHAGVGHNTERPSIRSARIARPARPTLRRRAPRSRGRGRRCCFRRARRTGRPAQWPCESAATEVTSISAASVESGGGTEPFQAHGTSVRGPCWHIARPPCPTPPNESASPSRDNPFGRRDILSPAGGRDSVFQLLTTRALRERPSSNVAADCGDFRICVKADLLAGCAKSTGWRESWPRAG